MASVSIFEGNAEHRFDVPPGYIPKITEYGGELVVDPNYVPAKIGEGALVLTTELDAKAR